MLRYFVIYSPGHQPKSISEYSCPKEMGHVAVKNPPKVNLSVLAECRKKSYLMESHWLCFTGLILKVSFFPQMFLLVIRVCILTAFHGRPAETALGKCKPIPLIIAFSCGGVSAALASASLTLCPFAWQLLILKPRKCCLVPVLCYLVPELVPQFLCSSFKPQSFSVSADDLMTGSGHLNLLLFQNFIK